MGFRLPDRHMAIILALGLAAAVYWPVLSSPRLPGGDLSDTVHQGYPFLSYTAASIAEGRIPHWNPYIYCGIPFFSSFSAPVFYPVRGLLLLAAGPEASVRFIWPVQAFIAALSAWLFLGSLAVSRGGRTVGTIAFAAGAWANTLFYAGHASKMVSWSFLPLLLYACERWWATRRAWFLFLGGLCLGMQALSSHPQMLLYSAMAATVWLAWRFLERPGVSKALAAASGLAAMTLVGAGLGAVQMLPGYAFSRTSTRGEDLPLSQSASYSMPPEETLAMAFPHLFGYRHGFPDSEAGGGPVYWGRLGLRLSSEFTGVSILLLAAVALLSRRTHRGMALGAVALLGLLVSWGGYSPFYRILYDIVPVFRKLRAPHMAAFLTTSGISLLAGPGFDAAVAGVRAGRCWKPIAAWGALCIVLLAFCRPILSSAQAGWWRRAGASPAAFPELVDRRVDLASGDLLRAALVSALVAGTVFAVSRKRIGPGTASLLVSAVAALELVPLDRDFQVFLPQTRIADLYPEPAGLREAVGEGRIFPGGNEFIPLGIRSVTGYHAARTQAVDDMLAGISSGGFPEVRSTGFTVLIDGGTVAPYGALVDEMASDTSAGGFPAELSAPMPRAFMPASWVSGGEAPAPGIPPEAVSTVSGGPDLPPPSGQPGSAVITRDEPELVEIATESGEPGLLVLADTWHPGWRVSVDGTEARLLRANGWMRAVAVPAGQHSVCFTYDASDFSTGLLISVVTALLTAVAAAFELVSRRRGKPGAGAA